MLSIILQTNNTPTSNTPTRSKNVSEIVRGILKHDNPNFDRKDINAYLAQLFGDRFSARPSNNMYHMVREAVEVHDCGVNIRAMARMSLRCEAAADAARDTPAHNARYTLRAGEYRAEAYAYRDRAMARIDKITRDRSFQGVPGAIQIKRLRDVKTSISGDPFLDLKMDDDERSYWQLLKADRTKFWLTRYPENIVGWLWNYRGNINIQETIAVEPFKTFSQMQFAYVCNAMYNYAIGKDTYHEQRVQDASLHVRSMPVAKVTQRQHNIYRRVAGEFNNSFNPGVDSGTYRTYPGVVNVRSLRFLKVMEGSMSEPNGYVDAATDRYRTTASHRHLEANHRGF
jgi:hypothetical protein